MTKKLIPVVAVLAAIGVAPAQAANGVGTKVKVINAFDAGGGDAAIVGEVKSKIEACEDRAVVLFDAAAGEKVGKGKSRSGSFSIETDGLDEGDSVYAKAKSKTITDDGERVTCKGAESKPFKVLEIGQGGF